MWSSLSLSILLVRFSSCASLAAGPSLFGNFCCSPRTSLIADGKNPLLFQFSNPNIVSPIIVQFTLVSVSLVTSLIL